ncbi:MAG: hypothetical protein PHF00_08880, partial [Elusimicrobia bacterium]|nr:hypothetical protein [Elusimicrobiota bacterium]
GSRPLSAVLGLERGLRLRLAAGQAPETLILAQHPEVFTLGRRARAAQNLPYPARRVDREGGIIFQGPGQLAGYAVFDLKRRRLSELDLRRAMAGVLAEALRQLGVKTSRPSRADALRRGGRKLAFVSSRGFALNVNCDLAPFRLLAAPGWTSLQEIIGQPQDEHHVAKLVAEAFLRFF